jgi:hypothetical protein
MRGLRATKRASLRKKPYSRVLTAASIAASKEFKLTACRADLMCCCVLLPKSQLLRQKKLGCYFLRGAEISSPGDFL